MNTNLKVSIIIPAYNVEEYICRGIESCINQTYRNIEIIIVDDGSTDKTASIINKYADKDSRIVFLKQKNEGVSSARNTALKNVTGKYVIFLDSDDWLELNTIEQLISRVDGKSFIICSRYIVDETNLNTKRNDDNRTHCEISSGETILESFLYKYYYFQSSCYKLFDVDIIKTNSLSFSVSISHGEDGLFVFEYLQYVNNLISIPIPLWNILDRSNSASNSSFNVKKLTAIDAAENMLKYNLSQTVRAQIVRYLVTRAESMYIEACLDDICNNNVSINKIKTKLVEYKEVLNYPQTTYREKIRFIVITFFPVFLVYKILRLKKDKK